MKKFEILRYLKRFSILIFLVSLAGAAAIYLYADGKQQYTASVIIRYTNDGISDGYTPDGSELDVNEIYSSTVISQAMDALARAADSALSDATGYQTEIVSTNYVNQKIRELDAGQPRLAEAQAMVNKLENAINEISEELFVLDKAYIKYKSQNYITFSYGAVSFLQRLSLKKTLMESVAVMLGGAWLLQQRKRRKAGKRK